jgi:DNA-binding NarL/FixJ family response regulator
MTPKAEPARRPRLNHALPLRVLVVEDFVPYRRCILSILASMRDLQVIGKVSDGLEAVQKAVELQPDLILLDIGLPKLNGIEAARQIHKVAPNSKILFVSAYDDLDIVGAALDTGASGYVFKSDADNELAKAVEAVFQRKRFVSSRLKGRISADTGDAQAPGGDGLGGSELLAWPSASVTETTRCHEVQFYSDDVVFRETVTHFIGAALKGGNAAIVFATEPHRESLLQGLKAQGVDVDALIQQGAYVSLDAAEVLSTFMINGWPDAARFFEGFRNLVESASKVAKAKHPRVAICGEGVALLWAEGMTEAAIRLEQLGNDLARTYNVDILCAYPFSLHIQEDELAFGAICAEHSAVHSA